MMESDTEKYNGGKLTGEEIVISGISGCFPHTEDTKKLIDNLYNKVDMVKKYEFSDLKHSELTQYCGKIENMDKFDNHFFRFTQRQATSFDPVGRKNMEEAYSAIFDAGVNPETLRGTKLGVFLGATESDTANMSLYDAFNFDGFIISGCSKSMLANRISYWIDGKGPSCALDYSCASSMACLELAVERMNAGECDSALIGACNYSIHPALFVNCRRSGLLCLDGKTKCFDKNGDGYVKSNAINLMYLQKAKDAKRIYAQIYHVRGEYFSTPDSLFLPTRDSERIEKFLQKFYSEINMSSNVVEYLEANATGIAEADGTELLAIGNIFGKTKPIKIGSIKSNMGNTEKCSGLCSLIKICLSYQRGEIPANLHYNKPQDHIPAIREGKIQVVTDNTKFDRSFTALNNFSYTGANYHVLLKGHYKPKDLSKYNNICNIPRLVLASGRLEQSVTKIFNEIENNPMDPEQLALLNNIFKYNIRGHTAHGYTILDTDNTKCTCLARGFELYDGTTRPIWFLYSGMGSQWPTMGAELMRLPVFAASIERCSKVLQEEGVDIIKIITNNDEEIFNNILNCFVGITAVQIALTDVLKSIGIVPDNIIGHSAGEISCAYADGSLTLEEAIMISYLRGLVSLETKMIKGKMAAIGLGHKDVRNLCPPKIDIACQNSSESTTISGPAEDVEKFVAYLTERSVFARTVASSNIAYHSRYIADAGPNLLLKMKAVIKNPKARSKSWLSTSLTPDRWSEDISLYASAEYFTNNILSTVYFEETAKMIPNNAVVIEIAPHGLMQAIMKRSHKDCINLSLTRRGESQNVKLLLQTIGALYQVGLNPDIDAFYPKVDFPVSTETSILSHLVDWDHSATWSVKTVNSRKIQKTFSYEFIMSIHDDDYSFYQGSVRNDVNIFPEAAVLVVVWKTLAMYNGKNYHDFPVEFINVKFHTELIIKSEDLLKLLVEIQQGRNFFEVTQNQNLVASGFINSNLSSDANFEEIQFFESDYHLNSKDIYSIMTTKGYTNEGQFKSIKHTNIEKNKGLIKWNNNWTTFLDSLFQLHALSKNHNGVSNIKFITKLVINVEAHQTIKKYFSDSDKDICYAAEVSLDHVVTKCGGVLLRSITFDDIPKIDHHVMTEELQTRKLFPHTPSFSVDLQTAMQVSLQVISEIVKNKIVVHIKNTDLFPDIKTVFNKIVKAIPSLNVEMKSAVGLVDTNFETNPDQLLYIFDDKEIVQRADDLTSIKFVIIISQKKNISFPKNYCVVTKFKIKNSIMVLLENTIPNLKVEKHDGYYYLPAQVNLKLNNINNMKLINSILDGYTTHLWVEGPPISINKAIQVAYCGVYMNDYNKAPIFGKNVNKYGVGFSGINARGERVMGIIPDGSVSSMIEPNYDILWPVPKHWNLEEAATVPLPYIQAYYCLVMRYKLVKRSTVLITKGDSALGQALISLCLNLNCTVFTTVSNIVKKTLLLRNFPELKESHIGLTNDLYFRQVVLNVTKKKRCDVVINFYNGKLREEASELVGFLKTFMDVSDYDMEENNDYDMAFSNEDRTYQSVRLSNLFLHPDENKKLQLMLSKGIKNGSVRPLACVTYTPDEISRAFKLLSADNISHSVLINMKNPTNLKDDSKLMQRIELSPLKVYIVMCDGTELGVELIEHLIERGAKRFLINMKLNLMNGYFYAKHTTWKNNDVIISFNSDDLYTKSGCDTMITEGEKLGGVDGIFITQNKLTKNMTVGQDIDGALMISNLDKASRKCILNHFAILFLTTQDHNERDFLEIEKCCFARRQFGLPSLVLRYDVSEKKSSLKVISKLYNALDISLKQNYTSVFLSNSKPKSKFNSDEISIDGLSALFIKMSQDENITTEPIITMKTLTTDEDENDLYLDPDDAHVMMIPGLDGNYQDMKLAAERLKIPAVTLQLELDVDTNIPDIAKRMLSIVKKRFHLKSKFYILGYSFGVNVALELAALLEKEGRKGVVFCLDSSPGVFKDQLIAYTGNMTDQQLQNFVIEHFYNLLTGETFDELKEIALQNWEWSEKINIFIDKVKGRVTHTHEFLKTLINVVYRRIVMAKNYEPEFKLNSEIVLMKGVPHPKLTELSDDYGLSKFSNKSVKVFNLDADHTNAPKDNRVSNIINKMLDPELLKDFENKNLCQYYFC